MHDGLIMNKTISMQDDLMLAVQELAAENGTKPPAVIAEATFKHLEALQRSETVDYFFQRYLQSRKTAHTKLGEFNPIRPAPPEQKKKAKPIGYHTRTHTDEYTGEVTETTEAVYAEGEAHHVSE